MGVADFQIGSSSRPSIIGGRSAEKAVALAAVFVAEALAGLSCA